MTVEGHRVAPWARWCGIATIWAALPTVVWRVVVGLGPTLGTPASWRASESVPGSGTAYVIGLSVVQLAAALLTTVLFVPGADRVPRWFPGRAAGARFPRRLVVTASLLGAAMLTVICVLSVVNWHHVDPFRDQPDAGGWRALCWTCYAVALAWPPLLVATTIGYLRSRPSD